LLTVICVISDTTMADIERDRRGRSADKPVDIPVKGWKDIFWRVYEDFSQHRIPAVAAGVTYYALLAIFPALAALVSIYGFFADPVSIAHHLETLSSLLPGGALQVIRDQVKGLTDHRGSTLGFTVVVGIAVSLWSASSGMKALFDALNIVYDERERRGFIKLNALAMAFTLAAVAFMLLSLAATVLVPIALNFVGLEQKTAGLIWWARWPALFMVAALALALTYRFGPSRARPKWRWISWGSAFASITWLGGSALFSWYAANFGHYDATYGTLGAAIGFLTWMWLSTVVVLLGAQINAEMEHQTARDTT
jgi:membrane protein